MRKPGKEHEELMALLDQVPGVREHMESLSVQLGRTLLKRRIELGLSQAELAEAVQRQGSDVSLEAVSQAESGEVPKDADTYQQLFAALGGVKDLHVEFGQPPKAVEAEFQKK